MARNHRGEARAGLDRQLVEGEMLGAERQGLVQACRPARFVVAGKRVDQIEADSVHCRLRGIKGSQSFGRRVGAAQEGERFIVEALQAETDPIDPGAGKIGETGGLGAVGIGFQGDFDVGGCPPMIARGGDDRLHCLRRHQRGRAPTEEDRGKLVIRQQRCLMRQVGEKGRAPCALVN